MKRFTDSRLKRNAALLSIAGATLASIAACGGGGSSDSSPAAPPAATPVTLSGTVAAGVPLAGASVTVIDADDATPNPAAVTAGADGKYSVAVTGLKAPLLVRATGNLDGKSTTYAALVASLPSGAAGTANVTPLTNAVAALVAPGGDTAALATPSALATAATTEKVNNANTLLVNTLRTDASIAANLGATFDPLTTPFDANGTGIDSVLEQLDVNATASGVQIANRSAAAAGTAVPAPIVLTAAQAATPANVPTLPASAPAGSVPTAAELQALGKKVEACLAKPVAQRVTLNAAGVATTIAPECQYVAGDYLSGGQTWAQLVGDNLVGNDQWTGAKLSSATIALALAALNETDPKVFKHPYCNTAPCVVTRLSFVSSPNGKPLTSDWVLGKVNGQWNFVGDQRPYEMTVTSRLARYTSSNTAGTAANPTNYFFADRIESQLRLLFSPAVNAQNVRAVRWTGPGLPAAGVVMFRSQACGTDDRFGINNQTGSTRTTGNVVQFWTTATSIDFKLSASKHDGSTLPMAVPNNTTLANQDFAPAPVTAAIPAWSVYTAEIFLFTSFATTPDVPDQIVKIRNSSRVEPAAFGATQAWPQLTQAIVDGYVKPTGGNAGAITGLTGALTWTAPAGVDVSSAYLFSQNSATATNSEAESASYNLRTRLDYRPAARGDTSAPAYAFATTGSGTALSTSTATNGTNPNPRCTSTNVVPLTTTAGDYREMGLTFNDADRHNLATINFWRN